MALQQLHDVAQKGQRDAGSAHTRLRQAALAVQALRMLPRKLRVVRMQRLLLAL